jgi:hypothetical protein
VLLGGGGARNGAARHTDADAPPPRGRARDDAGARESAEAGEWADDEGFGSFDT